jgi:hypothetical protein
LRRFAPGVGFIMDNYTLLFIRSVFAGGSSMSAIMQPPMALRTLFGKDDGTGTREILSAR